MKRESYKLLFDRECEMRNAAEFELKGVRAKLDIAEINIKNLQNDNRMWMAHVIVLGRAIDKLVNDK